MLVAKYASIYLRLRVLLVACALAIVVAERAAAQDAQPAEETPEASDSQSPEQESAAPSGTADPANEVSPDGLPPIEVTQSAVKKPGRSETVKKKTQPRVATTQPAAYRPIPAESSAGGAGAAGFGVGDAQGETGGAGGETAWGPVDGFVATRSASGIKTDTPIIEIPQSVSVITADRIDELGANSLNDALGYTAGVRPNIYGSDSRLAQHSRLRRLLSGLLFRRAVRAQQQHLGRLESGALWRRAHRVLKGPSSVLYGQMTPGGLINVITKRPTEEPFHEVEMQIGNHDRLQPAFDFGGPATENGKVLYRLTGLGLKTDTQVDFVDESRFYIAPAFTFRPSADTSLTILSHYLSENTGVTSNFLPPQGTLLPNPNGKIRRSFFSGEPNFDDFELEQWAISYLLEHRLNDTWELRQNARYGSIELDFDALYGTGLDPFDPTQRLLSRHSFFSEESVDQFVIDNQAEANFATGRVDHTMLFGADYQNNRFDQRSGDGLAAPIDMFSPVYDGFFFNPPLRHRLPALQSERYRPRFRWALASHRHFRSCLWRAAHFCQALPRQ
jgi:iron complex outermembrane receptor protein